ncbi:MAG: hypothetical protein KKG76_06195 [Euryarchaeota archaeon]|nr:hypothetical protein [Euryarchaeota archaeon]MBU4139670.1 hypothetical protein [Euryarchaeota archaeon]
MHARLSGRIFENSRTLQNLQHLVGGLHNILLVLVGVYFGKDNTSLGLVAAGLAFLVSRMSSEISFQTSIKVVQEYSNHTNYKKN